MPFSDKMPEIFECGIALCNWYTGVTLYEFTENYDPEYLGLDPNDENSWKIYAEKVRDIFAQCLNVPKVEMGYRHWKEFEVFYNAELKKIAEGGKDSKKD